MAFLFRRIYLRITSSMTFYGTPVHLRCYNNLLACLCTTGRRVGYFQTGAGEGNCSGCMDKFSLVAFQAEVRAQTVLEQ